MMVFISLSLSSAILYLNPFVHSVSKMHGTANNAKNSSTNGLNRCTLSMVRITTTLTSVLLVFQTYFTRSISQGRHFNFFWGHNFLYFSPCHRTIENWPKKQHFICSNLTLFMVPFLCVSTSDQRKFAPLFEFFRYFSFFSFSLGGGRRPLRRRPLFPLSTLSYRERLSVLDLEPLELRRLKCDLKVHFKLLLVQLYYWILLSFLFIFRLNQYHTRGHSLTIEKQVFANKLLNNTFASRAIDCWNNL